MNDIARVLYVNGGLMNRGGVESYMMNYYRHFDRTRLQVDFMVHQAGGYGYYDEEILSLGGRIIALPQKSRHPLQYARRLREELSRGTYRVVHTHMDAMGAWPLKVAGECGVPVRIAHSHNTRHLTANPLKVRLLEYARRHVNRYATHRMACSRMAGEWLFGPEPFTVVPNAIEVERFVFDARARAEVRAEYGIGEGDFLIGHVGRFDRQKNHAFMIDFFARVHASHPRARLLLVGGGELQPEAMRQVERLGLEGAVVMAGVRSDAWRLYSAFDLFVLPSLFEGLSVAAVEAQANGLPCLLSDQMTQETRLTPHAWFLPLDGQAWAERCGELAAAGAAHVQYDAGSYPEEYNIEKAAVRLQQTYLDLHRNG